ncbi:MAG: hypothetical protein GDA51_00175 [Ekhidna sp.]|nr:hypothetical protein [Ekhidna sp.]MBC6424898.1 hypothetical protein [Ekhidna sp.]
MSHTLTLNGFQSTPVNAFNVWNLDMGAGIGGRLISMNIDTKLYWPSDEYPALCWNKLFNLRLVLELCLRK